MNDLVSIILLFIAWTSILCAIGLWLVDRYYKKKKPREWRNPGRLHKQ